MSHVTCYMLDVTCHGYMLHVACYMAFDDYDDFDDDFDDVDDVFDDFDDDATRYMLHVTCYMLHVNNVSTRFGTFRHVLNRFESF